MDRHKALCPRTDDSLKTSGHYMNMIVGNSLPPSVRAVNLLSDRVNLDLIAVIDIEHKAQERWFFHNAWKLGIDKTMEAFADFREKIIYTRSFGSQNYQAFHCAPSNSTITCPDLNLDPDTPAEAKPKSFLDDLSYDSLVKRKDESPSVKETPPTPIVKPTLPTRPIPDSGDRIAKIDTGYITGPHFRIPKRPTFNIGENTNVILPQNNSTGSIGNAEWIPAGKSVSIHGIEVSSGMIYLGSSSIMANPAERSSTPAIINLLAPVNTAYPDHYGNKIGYWPSYSTITPEARAGYLYWLSGPKDNPDDSISWVFLYFYGLERRVVVDGNSIYASVREEAKEDFLSIRDELIRLRHVYGKQGSFNRYSEDLIHLINLMGNFPYTESLIPTSKHKGHYPWEIRVQLGQLARDREPLPTELALTYARSHPNLTLPKPAVRCPAEFDALFSIKYREKYGFGMPLPVLKRRLVFKYVPSVTASNIVSIDSTLPDVALSQKLEGALHQLVQECAAALSKYSRFLASNPDDIGSLKALSLLPQELLSEEDLALIEASKPAPKKSSTKTGKAESKEVEVVKVPVPVILDPYLIAEKEEETKKVSALLHDILSDEIPADASRPIVTPAVKTTHEVSSTEQPWLAFDLDEPHWNLLLELAIYSTWTQEQFLAACDELDLLPNGALDTLNEAALVYTDEPLTDTDSEGQITINAHVIKELLT